MGWVGVEELTSHRNVQKTEHHRHAEPGTALVGERDVVQVQEGEREQGHPKVLADRREEGIRSREGVELARVEEAEQD
jgi:hypothetical protein